MKYQLLRILLLLLFVFPVCAEEVLTLGIFAYRPAEVMLSRYQPLVDYLSKSLPGYRVRLRLLDNEGFEHALRNQELDFVFTNPAHFITLRQNNSLWRTGHAGESGRACSGDFAGWGDYSFA